jgi:peptidoglycan/LPS O-acetylase OafA/YrhL
MEIKPSARNNYLDWLRVLAILFVFVYHSTRFFNLEDWHVKNPMTYEWVEVWNIFAWNWMMPLIFVISGASLYYAVGKSGAGKFVKDKVLRLLVPYLVALFTHATLQAYLDVTTHGKFIGSYFQFLPWYFNSIFGEYGIMGIEELWAFHLWYLEVLFIFTLLLYPLMRWLKGSGQSVLAGVNSFLARPGMIYLLALPAVLLMAFGNPENPVIAEKEAGWSLVIYLWLLFTGFIVVSAPHLEAGIKRLRWLSLGMAVILTIIVISVVVVSQGSPTFGTPLYAIGLGVAGFSSWCWILAYFGLAMKYLDYRKSVLEYTNEAVLPFYILHQSVLICVGYFVVQWPIPDLLRWAVILLISFAVIMTLYEFVVRRVSALRFLFGMKPLKKQPAAQTKESILVE